jgi:hypothetical protein
MNRMIASREFSLTPFVAIAGRAKTLKKLKTARRRQVRATLTEGKKWGAREGLHWGWSHEVLVQQPWGGDVVV